MVDDIPFPPQVTLSPPSGKPLSLLGYGTNDLVIHFIEVKFTAIGIYLDPQILPHLQPWKAKKATDLAKDDTFFQAVISSPVDKFVRVVVIKEIKGSQYGLQLENAVRDGLVALDKYEDEEEEALGQVVEFFQHHYFKKGSIVTFYFPAASAATAVITLSTEGKEDSKLNAENANVVDMIKKWYMGGTDAVSPTTISSLATNLAAELSK